MTQQSLTTSAPSQTTQFTHYLSLATTSKTDQQRKDALAYLTTFISSQPVNQSLPLPTGAILPKLLPLILDGSQPVRTHLLALLRLLSKSDIADRMESTLLYIRAGMTNLATSIRNDALSIFSYLLEFASEEIVSCPGGWVKTLKCFMSMMGWTMTNPTVVGVKNDGWTSAPKGNLSLGLSLSKSPSDLSRQLIILSQFLKAGLCPDVSSSSDHPQDVTQQQQANDFPLCDRQAHALPTKSDAYAHLNLFGAQRDEDEEMYNDCESRRRVFQKRFRTDVEKGIEGARKAGGEVGRAGAMMGKVLLEGLSGMEI